MTVRDHQNGVPLLCTQMEGLKMIVRWLLGVKSSLPSTVSPTLRLLYSMVLSEGDLTESKHIRFGLACE